MSADPDVQRIIEANPDLADQPEGTIDVAVRVCLGCFDGGLVLNSENMFNPNTGIDWFPDQAWTQEFHKCSGATNPLKKGLWRELVAHIPESIWYQMLTSRGVRRGPGHIHPDWRS